jgi:hypothetical protein
MNDEMPSDHLARPYLIHVCKDGTITYRTRNQPVFNGRALPVFSVDTRRQAEELQIRFCRRQHKEHPLMPGKTWYTLTRLPDGRDVAFLPDGVELEYLSGITQMFSEFFEQHLKNL